TVQYVRHRIQVAGNGRASDLFTWPALRLLHAVSGGVPRIINMIAHRSLLTAFVEKRARITRRSVAAAYREIQAVPLPGTLSFAYRAGVAVAGIAVGGGLMLAGIPRFEGWLATGVSRLTPPAAQVAMVTAPAHVDAAPAP